eukprot:5864401-Amphidinium_carterae.1
MPPVSCEDDWTMATSTLVHWMATQSCSAKGSGVRHSNAKSYAETLLSALLTRVLSGLSFSIQVSDPPLCLCVQNMCIDRAAMLASTTVPNRRLLESVLEGEGQSVQLVRLMCIFVRALTVEKRRKPQRELLQRTLGALCYEVGVLVDLHFHEVVSGDLDMIPVAGGKSKKRGRHVSRTVRLARAKSAASAGDKRAFAAGAHWQQRKRPRVLQGSVEHVQSDKEGLRDHELRVYAYWSRLRSRSGCLRSVSICTDGTRSASGREILTFALAASGSREAMWLPVQ